MNERVFIPSEGVWGDIVSLMTYGAVVRYVQGGFEFYEMLAAEDYAIMVEADDE